ncbi:MAG: SGNH/GDSL hydrolase family protein [Clostridia bacterium]|nr:SGNH/GDSL hydrolase family protein [Clostridia bacterium]
MPRLEDLDKNLKVENSLPDELLELFDFHSCEEKPFSIHGVFKENGRFVRMPSEIAANVSGGVSWLNTNTAGGRVRFVTNSAKIAITVEKSRDGIMSHMPLTGQAGFDLYGEAEGINRYYGTFIPPADYQNGYQGVVWLPDNTLRTITLNMPLYSGVNNLFIGIEKGATLLPASEFSAPPVVYYGSSITQGGCASRPGCAYQAIVHRRINYDFINLGFSGNAKAEDTMMEYLSRLEMSAFVYDYDHNAPTAEHLEATHYKGYLKIRERHSDIPVIMMTRPKYYLDSDEKLRLSIVEASFERAVANGDKNVRLIRGNEIFDSVTDQMALVDNSHPADFGFFKMAESLTPVLKEFI